MKVHKIVEDVSLMRNLAMKRNADLRMVVLGPRFVGEGIPHISDMNL